MAEEAMMHDQSLYQAHIPEISHDRTICTGREHRASASQDRCSSKGTENQYCCVMG